MVPDHTDEPNRGNGLVPARRFVSDKGRPGVSSSGPKRNSQKDPSPRRGEGDDWLAMASAWGKLRARHPFPRPCGERVAEGRVRGLFILLGLPRGMPGTPNDPRRRREAVGTQAYLIRYGVMGHVGRFWALPECGDPLERGQVVVIQTDRGVELGEVLIGLDESPPPAERQRVFRRAGPEDLDRSHRAEALRPDRFALCQRVLQEGDWPWQLIDVEPLLDDRSTVLHYLGPPQLDAASLRARFRMTCDFDVVLETVGGGLESQTQEETSHLAGATGGCGTCGCSDGGCGTRAGQQPAEAGIASESDAHGCAATPHSGCASCGISRLRAARTDRRDSSAT
jgi:hypothetical protein